MASPMQTTATNLVLAFNGPWSHPSVLTSAMAGRAPTCIHTMLPRSLNLPPHTNDSWRAHFERVADGILDSTTTIDDVVLATEARRVVVRSSMQAETSVGPFRNEYVWFFTFDDEGREIVRIEEMLDSAATGELFERRRAAAAAAAADGEGT